MTAVGLFVGNSTVDLSRTEESASNGEICLEWRKGVGDIYFIVFLTLLLTFYFSFPMSKCVLCLVFSGGSETQAWRERWRAFDG